MDWEVQNMIPVCLLFLNNMLLGRVNGRKIVFIIDDRSRSFRHFKWCEVWSQHRHSPIYRGWKTAILLVQQRLTSTVTVDFLMQVFIIGFKCELWVVFTVPYDGEHPLTLPRFQALHLRNVFLKFGASRRSFGSRMNVLHFFFRFCEICATQNLRN